MNLELAASKLTDAQWNTLSDFEIILEVIVLP
jgi:hypothetical protein